MGNMWDVMKRQLPDYVIEFVKEFWIVYSVDEFACLPSFKLFCASWRGMEVTIQQVAGDMYSVKIVY